MTTLDASQIQEIIPHRYPMLLIDRVLDLVPGQRAVALRNVTNNEAVFQGHFPGNPVLPGVLIVESLAQTGAVALLSDSRFKGKTAYFGGIKQAKFRRMVKPGDQLRLEVELVKIKGPVGLGQATAWVGDQKACTAELTFMISGD
ncbi:3-hydroxyacyl-[acyl-carrier-protein] dehydratase FabZ [Lactobacillus nasalidis]|uniref:3-hydroxyacyl-[acyl-carrier-protein] dehydratase FabZ n=1 Tax=Lactobacillus nasalidis TaxID=2797258 RepID=A0ABQ3W6U2_9LACO|nr:3-hydroxyacyl-ACP dehydratase FabZ [Lactobacillus nasalidis]GHV96830.1 3-hydroxyacyl-[acyl-carrier-protein] dehydratase FabZ [Lactobacillus nasalidis]GHV99441.1 3-hydroxyacyl-[acyl-carrier-protein] dehydratase FabZ [Lactobacillus nasalidis]GHW00617.1 3-hydroxyacyl-[acyl-carrier-protein] dehydratase FabZ [Lactobacillus nasalidis]